MKVLLAAAALVLVAGGVSVAMRPPSQQERLRAMRVELRALKDSAETCSTALAEGQNGFKAYEAKVDSMRRRIAGLEDLVPHGVPADSYPTYRAAVDSFNAAVPEWRPTADSLTARRQACEARIEAHRMLADSVRALAEALGLLDPVPAAGSR